MTKAELILYVEGLRRQAIIQINGDFQKVKSNRVHDHVKSKNLDKTRERALSRAKELVYELLEIDKALGLEHIRYIDPFWKMVESRTKNLELSLEDYVNYCYNEYSIDGLEEEQNRCIQAKDQVSREYNTLLRNLKALKNANQGIKYLAELGIVVPQEEIKKADLMVPVDTKLLLVKGGK